MAHPKWHDDVRLVIEGFVLFLVLLAVVIVGSLV